MQGRIKIRLITENYLRENYLRELLCIVYDHLLYGIISCQLNKRIKHFNQIFKLVLNNLIKRLKNEKMNEGILY